jgi:hypothetical protein
MDAEMEEERLEELKEGRSGEQVAMARPGSGRCLTQTYCVYVGEGAFRPTAQ